MRLEIQRATVTDLLWDMLIQLMSIEELHNFRLVGGTSLSLLLGHRMSVDIDLFSDSEYGSIDFKAINKLLRKKFPYVSEEEWVNKAIGNSCYLGNHKTN